MKTIFHPLLVLLANLTDPVVARQLKDAVRQLQFAKAEVETLRTRLPKRIVLTPRERQRLIRLGKPLGAAIKDLITIVSPATFRRWLREEKAGKEPGKAGRRRRIDVRKLIVKLARENFGWGYTRVLGELRKLTSQKVSRQFVANVMREHGFDPGPKRGEKTWDEFLKMHAATLWQCDFFSHKVLTLRGVREFFVIAFLQGRDLLASGVLHRPSRGHESKRPSSQAPGQRPKTIPSGNQAARRRSATTAAAAESFANRNQGHGRTLLVHAHGRTRSAQVPTSPRNDLELTTMLLNKVPEAVQLSTIPAAAVPNWHRGLAQLIATLLDDDQEIRARAVRAVATHALPAVRKLLVDSLMDVWLDEKSRLRHRAAATLKAIHSHAIDDIRHRLSISRQSRTRVRLVELLGEVSTHDDVVAALTLGQILMNRREKPVIHDAAKTVLRQLNPGYDQ